MTGATGSRMDRVDVNELSEAEKERYKLKICLSDKLVVVAFLLPPQSSYLLPGAAQLRGYRALHQEEGGSAGQEAPSSGTSLLQTFLGKKIFKFRVQREKRQELFFPMLQLSTFLLVSMPPASAFRRSLADLKAKETDLLIQANLLRHSQRALPPSEPHLQPEPVPLLQRVLILIHKVLE